MRKVIVTGATGMIGAAVIRYLVANNIEVAAICRPNSNKQNNIPHSDKVQVIECNIDSLEEVNLEGKYDVFFHFAWAGTYGDSREDIYLQYSNVKYTLDSIRLANKLGCRTFVGAGSQAEYGKANSKLSSDTIANPETPYGITKYCVGKLGARYARQLGMKYIWVRILSIYGPGDNDYTMVMSTINKLLNHETPRFTEAQQIWDYLHCDDAARAMYLMAECGKDQAVYVLGSGEEIELKQYIEMIKRYVNRDVQLTFGEVPYSENQIMYLSADISELTRDTGFTPQITFAEGIKNLVEIVKSNKG